MNNLKQSVTAFVLTATVVMNPVLALAAISSEQSTGASTLSPMVSAAPASAAVINQGAPELTVGRFPKVDANDKYTLTLSLSEALNRALAKSLNIQLKQANVDRTWEIRDDKEMNMGSLGQPSSSSFSQVNASIQSFTSLLSSDINWNNAKADLRAEKDSVGVQVAKKYADVQRNLAKVQSAEAAYKYAQWQQKNVGLQLNLGVISKTNQVELTANTIGKQKALQAAQEGLNDAYHKFNDLVGLPADARPVLPDQANYQPVEEINVEHYISKALAESPALVSSQGQLDLAVSVRNVYDPSGGPYAVRGIDVQKGKLAVALTKQSHELAVRQISSGILTYEQQIKGLEEALRVARQNENIAKLKFNIGMATQGELLSARANLLSAEQAYFDAMWQHELLKIGLEKPWAWN
ncbi:TolC family protein [Heliophilum fasciatum]|uniref:Outer membrane protein TolC n=1 Tax=Heliophilum fasciatum TaxID=35700 RepID=A0A4R2RR41_9FIRM|nr:TolC family protein [Heliophilum fasciatum]MCW2277450.1 outer membrane protein TolC [Heliophilum fasciatum]TCP65259.1 outer membrane protein TolC [Heliophilum fasciatum]